MGSMGSKGDLLLMNLWNEFEEMVLYSQQHQIKLNKVVLQISMKSYLFKSQQNCVAEMQLGVASFIYNAWPDII